MLRSYPVHFYKSLEVVATAGEYILIGHQKLNMQRIQFFSLPEFYSWLRGEVLEIFRHSRWEVKYAETFNEQVSKKTEYYQILFGILKSAITGLLRWILLLLSGQNIEIKITAVILLQYQIVLKSRYIWVDPSLWWNHFCWQCSSFPRPVFTALVYLIP